MPLADAMFPPEPGGPIPVRYFDLQINRAVQGGYTVSTVNVPTVITLFACSTLDEALSFVRDNIMENARVGLSADQYKQLAEKGYISRKATDREEELLAPVAAIFEKAKRRGRRKIGKSKALATPYGTRRTKPGRPRKAK